MKRYPNLSRNEETVLTHAKFINSIFNALISLIIFSVVVYNVYKGSNFYDFASVFASHVGLWKWTAVLVSTIAFILNAIILYFNGKMSWSSLSQTEVKFENIK